MSMSPKLNLQVKKAIAGKTKNLIKNQMNLLRIIQFSWQQLANRSYSNQVGYGINKM
jgi:hypothetical protein